ncbi:MAG: hypothetical protein B7Y99_05435 [Caulobacterales bacterium 32-69-10]|nr:MAG: hypothetical protein B7Y99_05435 [Caulobacterales bacterium 32-69-10]
MSSDGFSVPGSSPTPATPTVFFERREFDLLLRLYGRMVAAGEWRDYAISGLADRAVFAVYRRASEQPLYRIEKTPALANRQGAWAVIGAGQITLRRGRELEQVLKVFDTRKFRVVE